MGEARVCIRCGTPARHQRFSCGECGAAVVYVATADAPAPVSAQPEYAAAGTAAPPMTEWAPPPVAPASHQSDSPADWGPHAPTASAGPPPTAAAVPGADMPAFRPGESYAAPEMHRRSHNAVMTAYVMVALVVVALVAIGAIGWTSLGGSGTGGVPPEFRAYTKGTGGQVYKTSRFTVRLPNDYTITKFNLPVGGYEVAMTGALARVGDTGVGIATGSMGAGATTFAIAHMPDVGQHFSASVNLSSEIGTVKTVTWQGRGAYDVTASSSKFGQFRVRFVVVGNRFLAFVVAGAKGGAKLMDTLTASYRGR